MTALAETTVKLSMNITVKRTWTLPQPINFYVLLSLCWQVNNWLADISATNFCKENHVYLLKKKADYKITLR